MLAPHHLLFRKVGLVSFGVLVLISEGFFSECRMIKAVSMVVSLVVVIFIIVLFVMVVFVIAHCRTMHDIAPHGATAAEVLISSSVVVQEGSLNTNDAIYYLRVKNG